MAYLLILIPALLAGWAMLVRSNLSRPWLLPLAATLHLAGVLRLLSTPTGAWDARLWLEPDPPGRLVLLLLSILFSACAWYTAGTRSTNTCSYANIGSNGATWNLP